MDNKSQDSPQELKGVYGNADLKYCLKSFKVGLEEGNDIYNVETAGARK